MPQIKKDIEKYHLASPTQQTWHCPFSQKIKKKHESRANVEVEDARSRNRTITGRPGQDRLVV